MSLIGIITNSKNEEYMKNVLSKSFPMEEIIFVTDKSVKNVKNIYFETVILDSGKIKDTVYLKNILSHAKYVILNSDIIEKSEILKDLNLMVMTYGFNNKATFTISSVSEDSIIICLQRIIENVVKKQYEPQEFEIKTVQNVDIHAVISVYILLLFYSKIQI